MFKNNQKGNDNKDLGLIKNLEYYLQKTKGFHSSFGDFVVHEHNGFNVIDESLSCEVGYKARAGEFFIKNIKQEGAKEVVYVQPRVGYAGISLSWLCKKYGLDLTLVMPASKLISDHQALCIEFGCKPKFARIAAMPNANILAKKYADSKTDAVYVPLGLYHEDVIAGGVRSFYDYFKNKTKPKVMWSVISTGVLTRTMQIALPTTKFKAVAVARNIQQGELGSAEFYSYHKAFSQKSDLLPDSFDSEHTYDSKGWDYINRHGDPGDWFFNVAGNARKPSIDKSTINSYRDWNEYRDFE